MKTPNEIRKNWNSIIENFKSRVNEEDFEDMEDSEGRKLSPELAAKINAELKGQTIKNPETDNDIQVSSALGYDKGSAVYRDAKKLFDKALEKVTGKQKSGAPDSKPAEEEPGKLAGDDFKSAAEKDQEPSSGASSSDDELAKAKANQEKALQLIKKNAPHLLDPEYQKDAESDLAAEPDSDSENDPIIDYGSKEKKYAATKGKVDPNSRPVSAYMQDGENYDSGLEWKFEDWEAGHEPGHDRHFSDDDLIKSLSDYTQNIRTTDFTDDSIHSDYEQHYGDSGHYDDLKNDPESAVEDVNGGKKSLAKLFRTQKHRFKKNPKLFKAFKDTRKAQVDALQNAKFKEFQYRGRNESSINKFNRDLIKLINEINNSIK